MELKGTRTEQNLLAAFSGESMARNKYLFFAEKAKQEGHEEVAELFEKMAQNEGVHGKLLYQRLKGVGSSAANLQEAVNQISKIERDHEHRFLAALAKLNGAAPAAKPAAPAASASAPAAKTTKTVEVAGYRCMFCGATYEQRPDVCGVCEAIGSFEPTTIQKTVEV